MEPVDAGAVDDSWELATPHPQGGAYWGEAEDHLQLLSDPVNEELPAVFTTVRNASALHLIPHHGHNILHLIVSEKVGDVSRGQKVVDQHQEMFLTHLSRLY